MSQGLSILGSTGSIGCNTLRVAEFLGDEFRVVALGAGGNVTKLAEQIERFTPELVAVGNDVAARDLFAQALAGLERSLGPDNPLTALTRAHLAAAKHRLGDGDGCGFRERWNRRDCHWSNHGNVGGSVNGRGDTQHWRIIDPENSVGCGDHRCGGQRAEYRRQYR